MNEDFTKQWAEMNKATMNAFKELGEINAGAMTRLTQRQMDMVNLYMEGGAKQLEMFGDAKNMQDVMATQTQLVTEFNEKLIDNARQTIEVLTDTKDALTTWAEKGVEVASNVGKKE